ncbi:hypothetical protein POM88_034467 [Heracleum sosnowskyi]|uniref:Ubiquitin-like protease family profile domain-containing protein n=1 Tax=Heracleum sosnowskyi TaxID=360622 RepID=A0AAD8HJB7_9APIA|nr:hypothetical protein POM88_034467 [Heracleum sosnowskyi]
MSFGNDRKIKITEEDVNDILGLPRGKKEVEYKTEKKKDDEKVQEWRERFPMRKDDSKITEKMICDAIGRSEDADLFFKQNFMVLMTNLFVRTNKSSFVDQYAMSFKGDFDKAEEYNWCKEVLKNLKEAHELWFENPLTQYYTGSLVFLLFLYLDRTTNDQIKVERTRPVYIAWKTSLIAKRSEVEMYDESFVKGQILKIFNIGKKEEEMQKKGEEKNVNNIPDPDPAQVNDENDTDHISPHDHIAPHFSKMIQLSVFKDVDGNVAEENEENVDQALHLNDNWSTPEETLKGVESYGMVSESDGVGSGIISIAREIQKDHSTDDVMTEEEMISQLKIKINQLETMHKNLKFSFKHANDLFPNNENVKEAEERLVKICQLSSPSQSVAERIELHWPECPELLAMECQKFPDLSANDQPECPELLSKCWTKCPLDKDWLECPEFSAKDWKIIDILGLNEMDRAYNKLHDFDDFLGELTIGGQTVDFLRSTRQNSEKSITGVDIVVTKPKREQKLGEFHKSPFLNRAIDFNKPKLSKAEEEVWIWINGKREKPMEEIFFWNNSICLKHQIQSLKIGEKIYTNVVDVFTTILNEEEMYRSPDSPHRFFCNTMTTMGTLTVTNHVRSDSMDKTMKFVRFCSNLDFVLHRHNVNINDVDLIFFPIHYVEHFYVVCFNLKNIAVEIIDNNKIGEAATSIYDSVPESLKDNFVDYMAKFNERKSRQLRNARIVRLQMKWRTNGINKDCRVFSMNHMETYMGNSLRNWDYKFTSEEGNEQKKQLEKARQIYAAKIIYSCINYLKDRMLIEIKSACEK